MSKEEKSFGKAVIAGGTSGAIKGDFTSDMRKVLTFKIAIIMFPTEFVKTQLQLQSRSANVRFRNPFKFTNTLPSPNSMVS